MRTITKIVIGVCSVVLVLNITIWSLLTRNTNTIEEAQREPVKLIENTVRQFTPVHASKKSDKQVCTEVDVVYTWVNGSDPVHKAAIKKYGGGGWDGGYRDYGVIRYSIRSVEKFMPWVRNIIIVTNGQVPNWANTSSPKLRIVTHEQIFKNKENLPTFNSNAIEANLHNIPGLAPCFLYLNDDMFVGMPINKET